MNYLPLNGSKQHYNMNVLVFTRPISWMNKHTVLRNFTCGRYLCKSEFSIQKTQCIGRITAICCKNSTLTNSFSTVSPKTDTEKDLRKIYKTAYLFEPIVWIKVLSRLKLYQTGFMISLIPLSSYFYLSGQADLQSIGIYFGLACFATVSLYAISFYAQKIIGMVGVNDDKSKVMFSHLSFWGKRVDKIFKIDEVIPFSDSQEDTVKDVYRKVTFFDDPTILYLFGPGGKVVNEEKFEAVFGKLDYPNKK